MVNIELSEEVHKELTEIREKLNWLKDEKDKDISKYAGRTRPVKNDKIINEALKCLRRRGLLNEN